MEKKDYRKHHKSNRKKPESTVEAIEGAPPVIKRELTVNCGRLNFRKAAATNAEVLKVLTKGEKVLKESVVDDTWVYVSYDEDAKNSKTTLGYVMREFLVGDADV